MRYILDELDFRVRHSLLVLPGVPWLNTIIIFENTDGKIALKLILQDRHKWYKPNNYKILLLLPVIWQHNITTCRYWTTTSKTMIAILPDFQQRIGCGGIVYKNSIAAHSIKPLLVVGVLSVKTHPKTVLTSHVVILCTNSMFGPESANTPVEIYP